MGNDSDFTYAKSLPNAFKIVLPIHKGIVLGWGLYPYSRTDINMLFNGSQDGVQTKDELSSTGGVNVSSASIAGSFRNYVRVGFAYNYNFGMISENWERTFPSDSLLTSSYYLLKRKFGGYSKSVGIVTNVTKWITLGGGYTTKSEMNQRITVHTGTISDPEKTLTTITTVLPETWRTGVMFKFGEKFSAGSDYTFAGWEKAARTSKEKQLYNDATRIGVGFHYNPTPRFSDSYYKKIPVSVGFSYGSLYYKSYPVIDTVTEKSVTIGVEFPLQRNAGSILTSFEYGKRGDKSKNGWDENFMCFGISFIGRMQ
jgi:long-subunit fatty acid transport protein